jgi:hypothetical protein
MALDRSALSGLLDAIRAGGDLDVVRSAVEVKLQASIDPEAAQVIGAGGYERSQSRTPQRNGSRQRLLSTRAGLRPCQRHAHDPRALPVVHELPVPACERPEGGHEQLDIRPMPAGNSFGSKP